MELEGRRGRGTREQREEGRGGGREGEREAERLPLTSETYFFALQHADKNGVGEKNDGVGLWIYFFKVTLGYRCMACNCLPS